MKFRSWLSMLAMGAISLGVGMVAGAAVQDSARPQLASDEAAKAYTVASYLAQGATAWQPANLASTHGIRPHLVVAQDGSGTHTSLQAALDALPPEDNSAKRTVIGLVAGSYRGQVCLQGKSPVLLVGLGAKASDVRIVASRYAGGSKRPGVDGGNPCLPDLSASSYGTFSSATLAIFSNDVQLANLTIENDAMNGVKDGVGYPVGAGESGGAQAVALMTQGDRIQLENVELWGHQDTLYVRAIPSGANSVSSYRNTGDRVYLHKSLIAGDVDFIFGAGTLVVDDSTIVSRHGRRTPGNGGHILAPSTPANTALGILVNNSRLVGEAGLRNGSISLGRAWDTGVPSGAWKAGVSPNGQAVVRDSTLGLHVGAWAASTSKRPFATSGEAANRFAEWRNVVHGDWSRKTLAANDGWAAAEGGTQGGSDALPEHNYTVHNRAELLAALAPGDFSRLIRVVGRIDLNTDANGRALTAEDYRDPAYDQQAFLTAYDPATWGKKPPNGLQEEARKRSARNQSAQVVLRVPSRTTMVGAGDDAAIIHGNLLLEKVDNVIIRNIHFSDAYDYFPAWDPNDNAGGEWNSEYDNITLRGATHVWIDHCTFDDGVRTDDTEPIWFGRRVQHHDGLLDIIRQSNWVTVSWNHFRDHDKTTLVGNSDNQLPDDGKLKVTFHHNWYERVKERAPRVRFGQVHVYNNLYEGAESGPYRHGYSIGLGYQSKIVSERNAWVMPGSVQAQQLLRVNKGDRFTDHGSTLNGLPIDLQASLRTARPDVNWSADVGWAPVHSLPMDDVSDVPARVRAGAGAGRRKIDP